MAETTSYSSVLAALLPDRQVRRRWMRLAVAVAMVASVLTVATATYRNGDAEATAPPTDNFGMSGGDGGSNAGLVHPGLTGPDGRPAFNAGQLAFTGAHSGPSWGLPTGGNNSRGIGYCVEEIIPGASPSPTQQPTPSIWTARDRANAQALIMGVGLDRVHPYASGAVSGWNATTGEFDDPRLGTTSQNSRRRYSAAHLGVRHFLGDTSNPAGPGGFFHNARIYDNASITGSGPAVARFQGALAVSHEMANWARAASGVGAPTLTLQFTTSNGGAFIPQPTAPGTYRLRATVTDSTGKPMQDMPVLQWDDGVAPAFPDRRSTNALATAHPVSSGRTSHINGRNANWPLWQLLPVGLGTDSRFMVNSNINAATTTDAFGHAWFNVTITDAAYELGFHTLTPGGDVELWRGPASQGNVVASRSTGQADAQLVSAPTGHLRITKTSNAGLPVDGTVLQLRNGAGTSLGNVTLSGGVTTADWTVTDLNGGPWTVHEITAPANHTDPGDSTVVAGPFSTLSTNAGSPTTGTVENQAILGSVQVNKASNQSYLSVAGVSFVLRDANGASLNSFASPAGAVTTATGVVTWSNIPIGAHPLPWSLFETAAPDHFVQPNPAAVVHVFNSASTNPAAPTTTTVTNQATEEQLRVRKLLTDPSAAPGGDLSGFEFSITNVSAVPPVPGPTLTTDQFGVTAEIIVPPGTYEICEVGVPAWALPITESPGCQQVVIAGAAPPTTFVYTNTVRAFEAATQAAVPVAEVGDTVTDYLFIRDTVTGRELRVDIGAYSSASDAAPAAVVCDGTTLEASGSSLFTSAGGAEQIVGVDVVLPATIQNQAIWFAGTITDTATNAVVQTLPCGDLDERVLIPSILTAAPAAIDVDLDPTARDNYRIAGLPTPGGTLDADWTVTAEFELYQAATTCAAGTSTLVGTITENIVANGDGTTTNGVTVTAAGSPHYFVESLNFSIERTTAPAANGPWTLTRPGTVGATETFTTDITAEHCQLSESFAVPAVATTISDRYLVGDPVSDTVEVTGFGDLNGAYDSVVVTVGLHQHDASTPLAARVCDSSNLVDSATLTIGGDGTYVTPDFVAYPTGVSLSFVETITVTRTNALTGATETFTTSQHGCDVDAQTGYAPELATIVRDKILVAGDTSIDDITVNGLGTPNPATHSVRLVGGLYRHPTGAALTDHVCAPGNRIDDVTIPVTADGNYATPGETNWVEGFVHSYSFELVIDTLDVNGAVTGTQTTAAHGCQLEDETVYAPAVSTVIQEPILVRDELAVDNISIVGFGANGIPAGFTAGIDGALHQHDASQVLTDRTCTTGNTVETFTVPVTGNGDYSSPGEQWEPGFSYSYQVTLAVTDGAETHTTAAHGCQLIEETGWAPDITTAVRDAILVGDDTSIDEIVVTGLGTLDSARYRATLIGGLYQHDAGGAVADQECSGTNIVEAILLPISGDGTFETPGEVLWQPGSVYSYDFVLQVQTLDVNGDVVGTRDTEPHGCADPAETTYAPEIATQVVSPFVAPGDTSIDEIFVTGLGEQLADGYVAEIRGGFYQHDDTTPLSSRVCDTDNRLEDIIVTITGDGTFTTRGEAIPADGVSYSYDLSLVVFVPDSPAVDASLVEVDRTELHGCQLNEETLWAPRIDTMVSAGNEEVRWGDQVSDVVTISGLPSSLTDNHTVHVRGGLYQHEFRSELTARTCTDDNMVAEVDFFMAGAGEHTTNPYTVPRERADWSYSEQVTINDGSGNAVWTSAEHGCQMAVQSFQAFRGSSGGDIPRTGSDATQTVLMLGVLLVAAGAALWATSKRRRDGLVS